MLIEVLGVGEEGEAAVEQGMGLLVEPWVCGIFLCLLSSPPQQSVQKSHQDLQDDFLVIYSGLSHAGMGTAPA